MQSSAAILAGGRASRFAGRDKGALIVGGRSIRARQVEVLRSTADDIVFVGGTDPHVAGTRHVPDLATGCGPMGGVYTALLEAAHDRTIVLACDLPFITAPFVEFLVATLGNSDVSVPRTAHGLHPLAAVYARRAVDEIARHIREGRLKMTDLFEDLRVHVVDLEAIAAFGEPDRLLANVNTLAEYAGIDAIESHEL